MIDGSQGPEYRNAGGVSDSLPHSLPHKREMTVPWPEAYPSKRLLNIPLMRIRHYIWF